MEKLNFNDVDRKIKSIKDRVSEKKTNETGSLDMTFLVLLKISEQLGETNNLLELIVTGKPFVKAAKETDAIKQSFWDKIFK